jgi:putative mycofactocin binding protein MftB
MAAAPVEAAGRHHGEFDSSAPWRLDPHVALRHESFGALAYHFDTRRLIFLKSPRLRELVESLDAYASADAALRALVPAAQQAGYRRALGRLAASEIISAR